MAGLLYTVPGQAQESFTNEDPAYQEAVEYYISAESDQAYSIFSDLYSEYQINEEWEKLIDVISYKVLIYRNWRELEESERLIDEADELADRHLETGHILYSTIYNNKAYLHEERTDLDIALEWAHKSVKLSKQIEGEKKRRVRSYAALGFVYDSKGEYSSAIEAYKIGVDLAETVQDYRERYYSMTLVLNNLGVAYRKAGMPEDAMQYYLKNQEFIKRLFRDDHPEIAMNYNNIGSVYYTLGDIGQAARYFVRAANILESNFGKNHQHVAAAYNNAGTCYFRLGQMDEAIYYLEAAQEVKVNLLGPDHLDTAIGHSNLASIYMDKGDYSSALENFDRSVLIRKNNYGGDHPNLINPYLQRSRLHLEMDHPKNALLDVELAMEIATGRLDENHPQKAEVYIQSGHAHRAIHEYRAALMNYQQAIIRLTDSFEETDIHVNPEDLHSTHPNLLLSAFSGKAELMNEYYLLNRSSEMLHSAYNTFQNALGLIETLQMNFQHEVSKLNLLGDNYSIFEGAFLSAYNLYKQTGREEFAEAAFDIAEQSKSRIAAELLHESQAREFAGIPEEITEEERKINSWIAELHQQLVMEREKEEDQDSARVQELQDSLFVAHEMQQTWIHMLEEEYPSYYEIKYNRDMLSLREVQEELIDEDEVVLNYLMGDENLFVIVIYRDGFSLHKLDAAQEVPGYLDDLRSSLENQSYSLFTNTAVDLYRILIEPVRESLFGFNQLLIIPDHQLHYLPFELLFTESNFSSQPDSWPYLIREFNVSYAPSLMVYQKMKSNTGYNANRLLAIAPFVNSNASFNSESVLREYVENLSPLPITRYETEQIVELFDSGNRFFNLFSSGKEAILLADQEASVSSIRSLDLTDYGYLHFATHAFVHESHPSLSGIILSGDESSESIIYLDDIYNLRLNADLVVLSACETGLGTLARGEGMIGFTRAFISSGANNLLVSMWKVGDRATSSLMIRFYEEFFEGADKSQALRQAKLSMLNRPETAFPSNWASFILVGR